MTTLISGWFQLGAGRPNDDTTTPASSPRKKAYLTVFDSCASLGPISTQRFIQCEIRLFLGGQFIDDKIIHAHGRFHVAPATEDNEPFLQADIHRFDIMEIVRATLHPVLPGRRQIQH